MSLKHDFGIISESTTKSEDYFKSGHKILEVIPLEQIRVYLIKIITQKISIGSFKDIVHTSV